MTRHNTKSTNQIIALLAIGSALCLTSSCSGFSFHNNQNREMTKPAATTSRHDFLAGGAAALLVSLAAPTPAFAKDKKINYVKGSKEDPDVQAKLSVCIFECTKPKGSEQKSRAECIPECKAKFVSGYSIPQEYKAVPAEAPPAVEAAAPPAEEAAPAAAQ